MSVWLQMAKLPDPLQSTVSLVVAQDAPWGMFPGQPDPETEALIRQYLKTLSDQGLSADNQGIWLQSGFSFLAENQGTTPLPAASVTKVATSLVALQSWGPDHQFETLISATGPIQDGVLQGDLVVQGTGDPLFVWEEAIALGNDLNRLGIRKVTGQLIVTGNFLMNFETDQQKAGELLKQALNAKKWSTETEAQYQLLPPGTPRPQLDIAGPVQTVTYGASLLPNQTPLVRHRSLPLLQIVKLMNIYSNNVIAETLGSLQGGGMAVAQQAAQLAGVPAAEISLINGSGLGMENRISPRAACALFAALQRSLLAHNHTLADLFPIAGVDRGSIEGRRIPAAAVVKTGTLNEVSALAGVLPTRDRGLVWFAILNRGTDLEGLRHQQDVLLQTLINRWGTSVDPPVAISPTAPLHSATKVLGDDRRNDVVRSAVEINTYSGS
jgi:D-alanyl-D-alanine carboxypeptidase/D-alanyl-D-alanine-endopeptidase (penicillin-binding protein 4)